jgi:hypothetical protein
MQQATRVAALEILVHRFYSSPVSALFQVSGFSNSIGIQLLLSAFDKLEGAWKELQTLPKPHYGIHFSTRLDQQTTRAAA